MVCLKHLQGKTRGTSSTNHKGELLHPFTLARGRAPDHTKANSCVCTANVNKWETKLDLPFLQFHRGITFLRYLYLRPDPVLCARLFFALNNQKKNLK